MAGSKGKKSVVNATSVPPPPDNNPFGAVNPPDQGNKAAAMNLPVPETAPGRDVHGRRPPPSTAQTSASSSATVVAAAAHTSSSAAAAAEGARADKLSGAGNSAAGAIGMNKPVPPAPGRDVHGRRRPTPSPAPPPEAPAPAAPATKPSGGAAVNSAAGAIGMNAPIPAPRPRPTPSPTQLPPAAPAPAPAPAAPAKKPPGAAVTTPAAIAMNLSAPPTARDGHGRSGSSSAPTGQLTDRQDIAANGDLPIVKKKPSKSSEQKEAKPGPKKSKK